MDALTIQWWIGGRPAGVAPPSGAMPHGILIRPPIWIREVFGIQEEEWNREEEDLLLILT